MRISVSSLGTWAKMLLSPTTSRAKALLPSLLPVAGACTPITAYVYSPFQVCCHMYCFLTRLWQSYFTSPQNTKPPIMWKIWFWKYIFFLKKKQFDNHVLDLQREMVSRPEWTVTTCNKNAMTLHNWRWVKGSKGTNLVRSSVLWAAGHIFTSKKESCGVKRQAGIPRSFSS